MDLRKLEELGLTRNESLVYTALLELGETKTGAISKKIGIHRVLIYDSLESLIKKGLASHVIKENIKYFSATNPENLVKFLEEKKKNASELIPDLNLLIKKSESQQEATLYEGIKGLKSAMNNMLQELTSKDEHFVFASGNMAPTLGDYYYIYQDEKKRKKIKTNIIYDVSFKENKEILDATYGLLKFYPLGPFPTDTWIYKNKVLIVTYTANPPIAVLITSKETAESYKQLFKAIWEKAFKNK